MIIFSTERHVILSFCLFKAEEKQAADWYGLISLVKLTKHKKHKMLFLLREVHPFKS